MQVSDGGDSVKEHRSFGVLDYARYLVRELGGGERWIGNFSYMSLYLNWIVAGWVFFGFFFKAVLNM